MNNLLYEYVNLIGGLKRDSNSKQKDSKSKKRFWVFVFDFYLFILQKFYPDLFKIK